MTPCLAPAMHPPGSSLRGPTQGSFPPCALHLQSSSANYSTPLPHPHLCPNVPFPWPLDLLLQPFPACLMFLHSTSHWLTYSIRYVLIYHLPAPSKRQTPWGQLISGYLFVCLFVFVYSSRAKTVLPQSKHLIHTCWVNMWVDACDHCAFLWEFVGHSCKGTIGSVSQLRRARHSLGGSG